MLCICNFSNSQNKMLDLHLCLELYLNFVSDYGFCVFLKFLAKFRPTLRSFTNITFSKG